MGQDVLPGTGRAPAFNPMDKGLYRRFLDVKRCECGQKASPGHAHIEHGQWSRACAEGVRVGECRRCGADLMPRRPQQITETRTDYEATCRNDECEWTCNAPSGRYLRYSSRQSERKGSA